MDRTSSSPPEGRPHTIPVITWTRIIESTSGPDHTPSNTQLYPLFTRHGPGLWLPRQHGMVILVRVFLCLLITALVSIAFLLASDTLRRLRLAREDIVGLLVANTP